jgi:hypothetical protein
MSINLIYTLTDPITNNIRYIGITSKTLKIRLSGHCAQKKTNKRKVNWIKNLKKNNLKPIIMELDSFETYEEALYFEQYWISQFKIWGFNLLNLTIGGEGAQGWIPTEEYKKNKSIAYSQPVIQYDLNGNFLKIWSSQLEAAKFYNVRSSALGHALKDPERCAVNFMWRRSTKIKIKISPYLKIGNKQNVMVKNILDNTITKYKSNTDAFKVTGRPTDPSNYINKNKIFKKQYKFYKE